MFLPLDEDGQPCSVVTTGACSCVTHIPSWLVKVECHEPSGVREQAAPIAHRVLALYLAELLNAALQPSTEETAS